MKGIVAYGGYVPKLRMERVTIAKGMSWLEPGLFKYARGERSIANLDEDAITMCVAAGYDCLSDMDKSTIDACYGVSTTFPYKDRDNTDIIRAALNLPEEMITADFTGSLKAGTTALVTALNTVGSGAAGKVLVAAGDNRIAPPASASQFWFGDGAGAVVVGTDNVIAEHIGSVSLRESMVEHYRGTDAAYDYNWEERFLRDVGYATTYPKLFKKLFEKTGVDPQTITTVLFPCVLGAKVMAGLVKKSGMNPESCVDNLNPVVGDFGAAQPLAMLAMALETASPGDRIIVAGYGQGGDALLFEATDEIENVSPKHGISKYVEEKKNEKDYIKWLGFNNLIEMDLGARAEVPVKASLSSLYRQRDFLYSLKGSKCLKCGTPQIPPARLCVNPECGEIDQIESYDFAERQGKVRSFSTNSLTGSLQRQAIVGYIDFDGGGRMLMDFTDCELSQIEVGVPVKMTFRRRWKEERGYTGYFWKAIPVESV